MGLLILLIAVLFIGVVFSVLLQRLEIKSISRSNYVTNCAIKGTARGAYNYIDSYSMLEISRKKVNSLNSRF